jgi:ATP synthase protein I
LSAPDPDKLNNLGRRLDELQTRQAARAKRPPPSHSGIAFRVTTELVASLIVGAGMGWGIDYFFHTAPWGLVVFFMLGAAAGFRGVMRTAQQINADSASAQDVEEK